MTQPAADDRIQAVVGLVLQAVDQRLNTVRDQMVQLNTSIIHSHNQLQAQIDECREMCVMAVDAVGAAPAGEPSNVASQQLMEVANVLTQHVANFETRVNQYTNDRVAELRAMIERLGAQAASTHVSQPVAAVAPLRAVAAAPQPVSQPVAAVAPAAAARPLVPERDDVAPAAARLGSLAASPARTAPAAVAAAPASATPPPAVASISTLTPTAAAPAPAAFGSGPIDLDELTAQMTARLSAAIDKALAF